MSKSITSVAYPTIPVVFLGGITKDRKPLYDTMGFAVTNLDETTRTETKISIDESSNSLEINFSLNGKPLTGLRGQQIISSIKTFACLSKFNGSIHIDSTNYDIYSGSSDSGLAALYTGLNSILDLNYSKEDLLKFAMRGSESAGRSLYGGLTLTKVFDDGITVEQIASEKELDSIRLFTVPFHYDNRISADEIHAGIVTNPSFNQRIEKIPYWVTNIISNVQAGDLIQALQFAEENIQNAHELLEGVGLFVRKPKMLNLCSELQRLRSDLELQAFYLIGGGNLITVATTIEYASKIESYLSDNNWNFVRSKVAGEPKIT